MGVKPKITATVEWVTPEMASQMLGTQSKNRPIRTAAVNRYTREMIANKWDVNGESIKFSKSGRLLDGQHRLMAIIKANKSVMMLVTRGLEDTVMATVDTGISRTYFDSTEVRGLQLARGAGPIARWWYKYLMGSPTVEYIATHQELDWVIQEHPMIAESARFIPHLRVVHTRCTSSVQGFVHSYTTEKWDRDSADIFMHTLNDGTALTKDDPIYLLRRRLVEGDSRQEPARVLAYTIKAWNAWISGKPLGRIGWQTDGAKPEDFPRFIRDIEPMVGKK